MKYFASFILFFYGMASINASSMPAIPGDFNMDSFLNTDDIDLLFAKIKVGTNDLMFDLTSDALVNFDDLDEWLRIAGANNLPCGGPYLQWDLNLDGTVDGLDLIILNNNFDQTDVLWSQGDLNFDGVVDGADLVILQQNSGRMSCPDCQPGSFNNMGICEFCPAGRYQDQSGQLSCITCSKGTHQDEEGQNACKECVAGTYADEEGLQKCKTCPDGYTSLARATSLDECFLISAPIPTLSQWGLIILSISLLIFSIIGIRKKVFLIS